MSVSPIQVISRAKRRVARVLRKTEPAYCYYQPQSLSVEQWAAIDHGDLGWLLKQHTDGYLDRVCADRAIMIWNAMNRQFDPPGCSLLDLGCNTGFFCHFFGRRGLNVCGVDSNSHNTVKGTTVDAGVPVVVTARHLSVQYGVSAHFIEEDVLSFLDRTSARYDFVLCLSLFHHFLDPANHYGGAGRHAPERVLHQLITIARKAIYFEMDHTVGDRCGYPEDALPEMLRRCDGVRAVNVIGISVDAWQRYRNIYECLRS